MSFQLSPKVDSNKIFLVRRSELEGRFDPIFYSVNLKKFISEKYPSFRIGILASKFISGVGAGKQDQAMGSNGIIQIRPTNIDINGQLKYDKNIYLPSEMDFAKIQIDDVLFNNTNSQELVGKSSILKKRKELFFSNHITKITVKKSIIIPDYLTILLNTYQKNRIFYSICTNWNNQSGIGLDLLKSLKIPVPPLEIQAKIVAQMDTAYSAKKQKETEAQRLLDSIDDYLLGELGIKLPEQEDNSIQSRIFTRRLSEVSGGRLDANYYSPYYSKAILASSRGKYEIKKISDISIKVFQGIGRRHTENNEFILLKVKNIMKNNKLDFNDVEFVKTEENNKLLKHGDILSPFIGEAIKQYKFSIFPETNKKIFVDNNTGVIRLNTNIDPIFISACLMSTIGRWQIKKLIGGGGVPFIGSANAKKIKIPIPPLEKQTKIANHISTIRKQAEELQEQAKADLEQAKKEVEAMILGD